MEAVFKTPEIVDLTLDCFRVFPPRDYPTPEKHIHVCRGDLQVISDHEKRKALYRMALTSRTISQIALPILWYTISGIYPLLRLVSCLEYNDAVETWVSNIFTRAGDLNTICFYFDVRYYREPCQKGTSNVSNIFPALSSTLCSLVRSTPLTHSSVRSIVLRPSKFPCRGGNSLWSQIFERFGSTISVISAPSCLRKSSNASKLLTEEILRQKIIQALHYGTSWGHSQHAVRSLKTSILVPCLLRPDVLKLKHLKKLTLNIWDLDWRSIDTDKRYRFYKDLEQLQGLQELDVGGLLEDSRRTVAPLLKQGAICYQFPALENLKFTASDGFLLKLLTQFPGNTLKEVVFRVDKTGVWDDLDYCGSLYFDDDDEEDEERSTFGTTTAFSLLGKQHFLSVTKLTIDGIPQTFGVEDFRPLLQIFGMKHFDIRQPGYRCMNDDSVLEMASAWPELECFRLYESDENVIRPTLASLQTFARFCPKLRRLSTDVDLTLVPLGEPLYQLEQLTIFSVSQSSKISKSNVPVIAAFLSATFPALMLAFHEGSGNGKGDDWKAVFRLLLREKNKYDVAALKVMLGAKY